MSAKAEWRAFFERAQIALKEAKEWRVNETPNFNVFHALGLPENNSK